MKTEMNESRFWNGGGPAWKTIACAFGGVLMTMLLAATSALALAVKENRDTNAQQEKVLATITTQYEFIRDELADLKTMVRGRP